MEKETVLTIEVDLNFKKEYKRKCDALVTDQISYKPIEETLFKLASLRGNTFMFYNPAHIGRGVLFSLSKIQPKHLGLLLRLPATDEDVDVLFDLVDQLIQFDECTMKINEEDAPIEELPRLRKEFKEYNRKLLMNEVTKLKQKEQELISIPCMLYYIDIDLKAINSFPNDQDVMIGFRDHLHNRQKLSVKSAKFGLYSHKGSIKLILAQYVITTNEYLVIPKGRMISKVIEMYGYKGVNERVNYWRYELKDGDDLIGYIFVDELLELIPSDKIREFDATKYVVGKFTREELQAMFDKAASTDEDREDIAEKAK